MELSLEFASGNASCIWLLAFSFWILAKLTVSWNTIPWNRDFRSLACLMASKISLESTLLGQAETLFPGAVAPMAWKLQLGHFPALINVRTGRGLWLDWKMWNWGWWRGVAFVLCKQRGERWPYCWLSAALRLNALIEINNRSQFGQLAVERTGEPRGFRMEQHFWVPAAQTPRILNCFN